MGLIGGAIGRGIGESVARDTEPAVASPRPITRRTLSLQIPANWTIATGRKDYDPDRFFFVNTAKGHGFVMVRVDDQVLDLGGTVDKHVAARPAPIGRH